MRSNLLLIKPAMTPPGKAGMAGLPAWRGGTTDSGTGRCSDRVAMRY